MGYTPELTAEEKKRLAEQVGNRLENGGLLLVAITGTSATNMSYRLKVSLAFQDEQQGTGIMWLNYWIATELKKNLTDNDEIRFSGFGYDRVHDIAYTIAEILKGYGFAFSLQNLPKFARVA